MQDATEHFHCPELVEERFRPDQIFAFAPEHITRGYCTGRRDAFNGSRQVWCRWKKHLMWIALAFEKPFTGFHSSSVATKVLIGAI